MSDDVIGPGFISITVSDVPRSARFCEEHLGVRRDPFDFGPAAVAFRVRDAGVPIVAEPFDGPSGRTFTLADPDGYRVTIYEKDQPIFWPPRS
jgi:hypothetical protein